jgi:hypothetical protein
VGRLDGFRPTAYFLDTQKVVSLPLTRRSPDGKEKEPVTILEVLRSLKDRHIQRIESFPGIEITTDTGPILLEGVNFNTHMLEVLLSLQKDEADVQFAQWFWYDHNEARTYPQQSFSFFVVSGDKIVRERVMFFDSPGDGFDPSVFVAADHEDATWDDEGDWAEAKVRYWYRKFYKETWTGQIMVLRPDEPKLYHYAEGRSNEGDYAVPLKQVLAFSAKIHTLLWVLIILVAAIAIRL